MTSNTAVRILVTAAVLSVLAGCASHQFACTRFVPVFGAAAVVRSGPAGFHRERTVSWEMNNVLFSSSDRSLNKFRDFDESTMLVSATLYDNALVAAVIDSIADGDSTAAESVRAAYQSTHEPERLVRIRVVMQAFFARRSVDPSVWIMYLVDENGDMYEPEELRTGTVREQGVPPAEGTDPRIRARYRTVFDIYFSRETFYGQPLIPSDRGFLRLVFSYNRRVVGGGGWCFQEQPLGY